MFLKQVWFYFLGRCIFLFSEHSYISTDWGEEVKKTTAKSKIPKQHFLRKPEYSKDNSMAEPYTRLY